MIRRRYIALRHRLNADVAAAERRLARYFTINSANAAARLLLPGQTRSHISHANRVRVVASAPCCPRRTPLRAQRRSPMMSREFTPPICGATHHIASRSAMPPASDKRRMRSPPAMIPRYDRTRLAFLASADYAIRAH